MSLILEALKKLERERETTGRGFLVVAPTPWGTPRSRARLALLALAGGAIAGAGAWGAWTWLSHQRGPTPAVPATAATAQAQATALPPPIWETPRPSSPPVVAAASVAPAALVAPSAAPAPAGAAAAPSSEPPVLEIAPRDPPPASAPALRLEAISAQGGEPVAVINGRLVRKGDTIEGALVTWIGADAVEVEVAGRRRVLGF